MKTEKAYFAGGCFWCITPAFAETDGVLKVVSGYCGGTEQNPVYKDVKEQKTGHRETIEIIYDADRVSYPELLEIFLNSVDPFDGGGQYIDRGHSYTLAVYYNSEAELTAAERALESMEGETGRKVFVRLEPFNVFYEAEEYHQDYYLKNPEAFRKELIESGRIKE